MRQENQTSKKRIFIEQWTRHIFTTAQCNANSQIIRSFLKLLCRRHNVLYSVQTTGPRISVWFSLNLNSSIQFGWYFRVCDKFEIRWKKVACIPAITQYARVLFRILARKFHSLVYAFFAPNQAYFNQFYTKLISSTAKYMAWKKSHTKTN